jgi:thioredoxin-related protein
MIFVKKSLIFVYMKRNILLLFTVLLAMSVNAQSIKWYTFEEAVKLNKTAPKKIFIDLYTDWCGWCKVMDRTTFADTVVAKYMTENFYAVKFNAEGKDPVKFYGPMMKYDSLKKERVVVNDTIVFKYDATAGRNGTHGLAMALTDGKLSYPTFIILDSNFQRLDIIAGYQQAPVFETQINYYGSGANVTTPYDQFVKDFKPKAQPPAQNGAPGAH